MSQFVGLVLGLAILVTIVIGLTLGVEPDNLRTTDALSPPTAVAASILALSLVLKRFHQPWGGLVRVWLKFTGLAVVIIPIIGYLFDPQALLSNPAFSAMALHTAVCLLLLLLAPLMLDPLLGWVSVFMQPGVGSRMARRLMPFIVLGPLILCGLTLLAVNYEVLNINFRLAVLAYAMIVSTGTATLYFARVVNDSQVRIDETEQQLIKSERIRQESNLALERAQKVEALGQLVSGVAHDFNNTLTVVLGNLELIGETDDKTTREDCVAEAIEAANHAAHLTRQLLAYGRKSRLETAPHVLQDLIEPTLLMFARLRPASISIETDLDGFLKRLAP